MHYLTKRRLALWTILGQLLCVSMVFPQQSDEPTGWEKTQIELIELEFARLTRELALSQCPQLSDTLEDEIKSFERREIHSAGAGFLFSVPPPLRKIMWEQLENVGEYDSTQLKAYIANANEFLDLSRQDAITCFTVFLDNHLFLNEKQFDQMRQVVDSNWCEGWNIAAYLTTFRSNRMATDLIASLDRRAAEKVLTDTQLEVFDQLDAIAADPYRTFMNARNGDGLDFTVAEACIQKSFVAQIGELENICELTSKQRTLLNVAKNGALKSVREAWSQTASGEVDNQAITLTPLLEQLLNQPTMKKSLRKILTQDQLARLETEQLRRQKIRARCFVNYLLFYSIYWHGDQRISKERRNQITERMLEKLNNIDPLNFPTVDRTFREHAENVLNSVLTNAEWNAVGPHINN